jgi:hypothetical protein
MRTNATQSVTNAPGALTGLRDPLDPWTIIPIWEWVIGSAIALLLLGLVLFAFMVWWRARKRRLNKVPEPPPPLPAHVRARQQLEGALRLLSDPNRFCTELSWILRRYLEDRFGWNVPDRTTEEFLHELRRHEELPESLRTLLAEFLVGCDMVKFARHDPTESELRELHRSALRVVADTVPLPPAASDAVKPPAVSVTS